MKNLKYFILSFIVILLDQISKLIVIKTMPIGTSIPVIGDLFRLTHVQNTGAAFSFSLGSVAVNKVLFSIIAFVAVCGFIYVLWNSREKLMNFVYALIIGGAIGNLIDRVRLGAVTDFLDSDFPDFIMYRWPIFNIADSAIVIAISLFILNEILQFMKQKRKNSENK